jgi:hypothetical protein
VFRQVRDCDVGLAPLVRKRARSFWGYFSNFEGTEAAGVGLLNGGLGLLTVILRRCVVSPAARLGLDPLHIDIHRVFLAQRQNFLRLHIDDVD